MFPGMGGYGGGAPLSAIQKIGKQTGEKISSIGTQVGLAGAEAKWKEGLTRDQWKFQSDEAEKLRIFNKQLTQMGFSHEERMQRLLHQYRKDEAAYGAGLQESMQPSGWESLFGGLGQAGMNYAMTSWNPLGFGK